MILLNISKQVKQKIENLLSIDISFIQQFHDEHFEKEYDVYLITTSLGEKRVLKKTSYNEYLINQLLEEHINSGIVPTLFQAIHVEGDFWLLFEYVEGDNLSSLSTEDVSYLAVSLADISNTFYEKQDLLIPLFPSRELQQQNKFKLLDKIKNNTALFSAYSLYIERNNSIPLTLAHDDLLPLNIMKTKNSFRIIDWEHGRKSSYITDLTRFCCFYFSDKMIFEQGLGFWDPSETIPELKELFYSNLSPQIKKQISLKQFQLDYDLETLNQYLMNLSHLESINHESLQSDWEKFFYLQAQTISNKINF